MFLEIDKLDYTIQKLIVICKLQPWASQYTIEILPRDTRVTE